MGAQSSRRDCYSYLRPFWKCHQLHCFQHLLQVAKSNANRVLLLLFSKNFIQGSVKQIQSGNGFYFALNTEGVLFGWGDCQYLGISDLRDREEQVVPDIINPIILMKRIEYISAGLDHCVAITHNNRIIAWGNPSAFSERITHFVKEPIDITEEYGGREDIKLLKAGHGFTALVTQDNTIRIIGATKGFQSKQLKANF